LNVQRKDRQTPYVFLMNSYGDALKAEWIAANIIANRPERTEARRNDD
jgi:hypothetical protein